MQLAGDTPVPLWDLFEPASDESDKAYALNKAPALTAAFYCFNRLTNLINQPLTPVLINT